MISEELRTELSKVQGLFEAFEYVNIWTNHGPTFTVDVITGTDAATAVAEHVGITINHVSMRELEDVAILQSSLERFLFEFEFQFKTPEHGRGRVKSRTEFIGDLVERLFAIAGGRFVWCIDLSFEGFYEADWDDFLICGSNAMLFLHLGVSD